MIGIDSHYDSEVVGAKVMALYRANQAKSRGDSELGLFEILVVVSL